MDEIKIKPNLVIFELFGGDKDDIISINCSEILVVKRGRKYYKNSESSYP